MLLVALLQHQFNDFFLLVNVGHWLNAVSPEADKQLKTSTEHLLPSTLWLCVRLLHAFKVAREQLCVQAIHECLINRATEQINNEICWQRFQ